MFFGALWFIKETLLPLATINCVFSCQMSGMSSTISMWAKSIGLLSTSTKWRVKFVVCSIVDLFWPATTIKFQSLSLLKTQSQSLRSNSRGTLTKLESFKYCIRRLSPWIYCWRLRCQCVLNNVISFCSNLLTSLFLKSIHLKQSRVSSSSKPSDPTCSLAHSKISW